MDQTVLMAFGQPSGPPASFRQMEELSALLQGAGHSDFRDARGPMGFTQRQAGGKFTRDEAAAFIERLQGDDEAGTGPPPASAPRRTPAGRPGADRSAGPTPGRPSATSPGRPRASEVLGRATSEQLAAELVRRGWTVRAPAEPGPLEGSDGPRP